MNKFKIFDWQEKHYIFLKQWLKNNSDQKYKEFQQKIVKTKFPIVGVKMPLIRKLAGKILEGNAENFLKICKNQTLEEIILKGIVISKLKVDFEGLLLIFDEYINIIDNWAVCDIVTNSLKSFFKNQEKGYKYIKTCINSTNPWKIRVGIVAMLSFYVNETYIEKILKHSEKISQNSTLCQSNANNSCFCDYYVKMSNAWLISICFVKFPNISKKFLESGNIDRETFKMLTRKILDSHKVSADDKEYIRLLYKNRD